MLDEPERDLLGSLPVGQKRLLRNLLSANGERRLEPSGREGRRLRPLVEMDDQQRLELHEALLDADTVRAPAGEVAGGDHEGRAEPTEAVGCRQQVTPRGRAGLGCPTRPASRKSRRVWAVASSGRSLSGGAPAFSNTHPEAARLCACLCVAREEPRYSPGRAGLTPRIRKKEALCPEGDVS